MEPKTKERGHQKIRAANVVDTTIKLDGSKQFHSWETAITKKSDSSEMYTAILHRSLIKRRS